VGYPGRRASHTVRLGETA